MRIYVGLLLLVYPTTCKDGCTGEKQILCGDTCIDYYIPCLCGGKKVNSNMEWCCASGPCTNSTSGGSCPGALLPLTSPCKGSCNHHPEDVYRGQRSFILCRDGQQCVKENDLCYGAASCRDSSDWPGAGRHRGSRRRAFWTIIISSAM